MNLEIEGTKVIQVIATTQVIGKGTSNDPYRSLKQLFTLDGQLICEFDQRDKETQSFISTRQQGKST